MGTFRKWTLIVLLALGYLFTGIAFACGAEFTAFRPPNKPDAVLVGNWQSCLEHEGYRQERIFDYYIAKHPVFEFHMGPGAEFAVFAGVQDTHRRHETVANLLGPRAHAGDTDHPPYVTVWRFVVEHVAYWLQVSVAGGSSDACEGGAVYPQNSYWVELWRVL